jgi:4-hydroxy-3-polyprenylbenzoate decarboxylase
MREVKELLVAITGASGAIYADRLLRKAAEMVTRLDLVLSTHGAEIAAHELGWAVDFDTLRITGPPAELLKRVQLYRPDDLSARYSSGSAAPDAMIIIPCSMNVAGRIASGLGDGLIPRAASVCLKERRPLVLVVREAPLNLVDLRNLVALTEAGATVMPAAPPFYAGPKSIEELADYFVVRVLDQVGLRIKHPGRWAG